MNHEQLPQQDIVISPQERHGMEQVLGEYIDDTICAPDTGLHRELSESALALSRHISHRQFDHSRFLLGLNAIAIDESQPTYARLVVLRSISQYKNRFGDGRHAPELEIITRNLAAVTRQWADAETRQTGFLDDSINQDVHRRQLLVYAACYNALNEQTPVNNSNATEQHNSKWLRVASDFLPIKRLSLHLPYKDHNTGEDDEQSIHRPSSGYPKKRVLCPKNDMAEWEKFEEACVYGMPDEKSVFKARCPSALIGIETERIETEPTSHQISRKSKLYYLRMAALPHPESVTAEMGNDRDIVPEQTLVTSDMITNLSYAIAMRSIKDAIRRQAELGLGMTISSGIVLDCVQRNVQRITRPVTHPGYARRVEAGLPTKANTILDLAIRQHREETTRQWTNREQLCRYLVRAASSIAIDQDQQTSQMRTRSFDEIHKLVTYRTLMTKHIDALAEFTDYFINNGEREFLNDTERAYIEQRESTVRRILSMYRVMKIEQPGSVLSSSEFPVDEWEDELRRLLYHATQVRVETIRDFPVEEVDSINWQR